MPVRCSVEHLTYTYPAAPTPALREVAFDVTAGEVALVAGANGAGKSTLLAALAGFAPHFFGGHLEGDVWLDAPSGERLSMRHTPLAEWVTRVGLVFSNPFNQMSGARLTVFEEVAFGLENLGVPPDEIRRRVAAVLDQLGLAALADRSSYALSGGQQQRVAIASILVLEPELLALDEPTAQLDPEGTREVLAALEALSQAQHIVVVATHDLEAFEPLATHGLVLRDGRVARRGAFADVVRQPGLAALGVTPPLSAALESGAWKPWSATPPPFDLTPDDLALPTFLEVRVENVAYRYPEGVEALRSVSLVMKPGQVVALVGRNGAGKTTLSKMLIGLLRPEAGRVLIGEHDARAFSVARLARWVGYVFQNPADQIFKRTVWDEVAFGPRNLGFSPERLKWAVELALAACGLEGLAAAHPYELLPNQRRWVTLASALAMETPVLVLDEPTGGFDRFDHLRLRHLLRALRAAGRTLLLITHDMSLVAEVADQVVVMGEGRVLAEGTPRQILTDDELLARAGLEPPPVVRVGRMLKLPREVCTEEELAKALRDRNGGIWRSGFLGV